MGRQIGFNFDPIDDELVHASLEKFGKWLVWPLHPTSDPESRPLRESNALGELSLAVFPEHLESLLRRALRWNDNVPPTLYIEQPARSKVLEWKLTETTGSKTIVGEARLYHGTDHPEQREPLVERAFGAVSRTIQRESPLILDATGPARFIGRHLAARARRGEVQLAWRSGKSVELLPNPRLKPTRAR